jgi:hypothetical protein
MKKYYFLALILFAAQFSVAQIDYNKLKKQGQSIVKQVNTGNNPLSNDEIIEGLREALTVGSNNASKAAAAVDDDDEDAPDICASSLFVFVECMFKDGFIE